MRIGGIVAVFMKTLYRFCDTASIGFAAFKNRIGAKGIPHLESHQSDRPRRGVMTSFAASLDEFDSLYRELSK